MPGVWMHNYGDERGEERRMKWFKHISDSIHDPFIFNLINLFGADGYLVFFGTLEIYSREFKTELDWNLSVTRDYLKQKLCKRQWTLVEKILKHISNSGKWEIVFDGDNITIYIPKFRELLDETTLRKLSQHEKTIVSKSGVSPKKPRTEVEVEVDKEKEKHTPHKVAFTIPKDIDSEIWKAFEEMRKKIRAPLTDKARSLIVTELNKIGGDKNKVLEQSIEKAWRGVFPLKDQTAIMSDHPGDEAARKLQEIYGKN